MIRPVVLARGTFLAARDDGALDAISTQNSRRGGQSFSAFVQRFFFDRRLFLRSGGI